MYMYVLNYCLMLFTYLENVSQLRTEDNPSKYSWTCLKCIENTKQLLSIHNGSVDGNIYKLPMDPQN